MTTPRANYQFEIDLISLSEGQTAADVHRWVPLFSSFPLSLSSPVVLTLHIGFNSLPLFRVFFILPCFVPSLMSVSLKTIHFLDRPRLNINIQFAVSERCVLHFFTSRTSINVCIDYRIALPSH